ncbi:peroxisomal targeting signal 1 receptor, partial [Nannochloropsis gaditana]
AENDEDKRAIACLERAVDQDPHSLPALLALGVSYVNELDSVRALQNLKAWVEHNPKYQGLEIRVDEYSDGSLMDEVTQLMLQAQDWDRATCGPEGQDADVEVVLGVLYNVSHDYDSAAAAFRQALVARPSDYSLWNKLGATLANSQRSDEALPAYHRALDLKPKYARGWLNLGISHANLGRYEEAARCYLRALRLNPEAGHMWGYLRVTFTSMERFDLVQLAGQQDPSLFEAEFGR